MRCRELSRWLERLESLPPHQREQVKARLQELAGRDAVTELLEDRVDPPPCPPPSTAHRQHSTLQPRTFSVMAGTANGGRSRERKHDADISSVPVQRKRYNVNTRPLARNNRSWQMPAPFVPKGAARDYT